MDVEELTYLAWEERKLQVYLTLLDEIMAAMPPSSLHTVHKKRLFESLEAGLLADFSGAVPIIVHVGHLPVSTANLNVTWI